MRPAAARAAILALLGVVLWGLASPGAADVTGPCTATVDGKPLDTATATDPAAAITVAGDAQVPYTFSAEVPVTAYSATAYVGPVQLKLDEKVQEPPLATTTGSFDVAKVSDLGVGVYKVTAHATLQDGRTCEGTFLIRIEGSPLGSAAGIAAAAVFVLAAGGLIAVSVQTASGIKTLLLSLKVP